MLKKALPLVLMSGLVLTACNNNGAVPDNNETPMENVNDRTGDRNNGQTGPDLDGIDNNGDMNDNRVNNGNNDNGIIDNTNPNDVNDTNGNRNNGTGDFDETTTTPRGNIIDDNNTER